LKQKVFVFKVFFEFIRCAPHLLLFALHKNRNVIYADVDRWVKIYALNYSRPISFLYLLSFYPEYRNVFYLRIGTWKHLLNIICPRLSTLYIYTNDVGKGLFIQHGFATIIAAKSIGENCWINQQVTIGYSNDTDMPTLNNNVTVNAGAKVIGNVLIGDNSIVGANAVVVKNVPANCTVVGVPAYIIKRDGIKVLAFNQKL
jgi:serine O-acetyltransferase